jgi:hypothetical protein
MNQITPKQAHQVWLQAAEMVKDRVISPTLFRALELPVGITLDGDEFILGFANPDIPMSSHLMSAQHRAIVEQCIGEILKRKVRLRVIEGTTLQDYENYKRQVQARESTQISIAAQRDRERVVIAAWDEVGEKITRLYARLHLRQLPQMRAEFMWQAFRIINQAVDEMGYDENSDDIHKRSIARVFDKYATVVEVPAAMLAFEFFKLRREGKLS